MLGRSSAIWLFTIGRSLNRNDFARRYVAAGLMLPRDDPRHTIAVPESERIDRHSVT